MTAEKPELIVISQYLLGGVPSFHWNMLNNMPKDYFDIKCIYLDQQGTNFTKPLDKIMFEGGIIFSFGNESVRSISNRLEKHLTNREGAIVTNFAVELIALDLYPKRNKTIYFICHDDFCIRYAVRFENIIDVFIAHNTAVFHKLIKLLPGRKGQIHYIPHGVKIIPGVKKAPNIGKRLELVFLARHHILKGLYELPLINDALVERGIDVNWTILGDGPERERFINQVRDLSNFLFEIPKDTERIYEILSTKDLYILPSKSDGLPVSMLEAMSVGCIPVVANFSEGIKQVITPDIGFVVEQGNIEMYANCICELHEKRGKLTELSMNCINKAKAEFDIKKQAMAYYALYKNYKILKTTKKIKARDIFRKLSYNSVVILISKAITSLKYRVGIKKGIIT